MVIYVGADHRGFKLKERIKDFLHGEGYTAVDVGNKVYDKDDDYPDFAIALAKEISADSENGRGILICGSGAGVDFTADKFKGVRSVLAFSADQIYAARNDDDVNVLSLAADFLSEDDALKIVKAFLVTPFRGEERQRRRLKKITELEENKP